MRGKPGGRVSGRWATKRPTIKGSGRAEDRKCFDKKRAKKPGAPNDREVKNVEHMTDVTRGERVAPSLVKMLEKMPAAKWYSIEETTAEPVTPPLTFASLEDAKVAGEKLASAVGDYVAAEEASRSKTPWLQQLTKKGTMTDRVSALVLMIQQIPVARLEAIRQLLRAAAKLAARREATLALNALKDVLIEDLLPPDRKLQFFRQNGSLQHEQSGAVRGTSWALLAAWFEDALKSLFAAFIVVLHQGLRDTVAFVRHTCLRCACELLVSCPEQESANLGLLAEQLCGVWQEDGLLAVRHLRRVLEAHPQMQPVVVTHVVEEVRKRLAVETAKEPKSDGVKNGAKKKKSSSQRDVITRAVAFLSEIKHSKKHPKITHLLIELFSALLHSEVQSVVGSKSSSSRHSRRKVRSKGGGDASLEKLSCSTLMRLVMTGLSRAVPFAGADLPASLSADWDALNKLLAADSPLVIRMGGSAKIALYVMLLRLGQLLGKDTAGLLSSLYGDIRDCSIVSASNCKVLFNLLDDLLKTDPTDRLLSFKRRLLQVAALLANPAVQVAVLAQVRSLIASSPKMKMLSEQSDAKLQRSEIPLEDLKAAGCPSTDAVLASPTESILQRFGYKEKGGDPRYARPDMSALWELHLLRSSVVPNVAQLAARILSGEALPSVSEAKEADDLSDAAILTLLTSDESAESLLEDPERESRPQEEFLAKHLRDSWVREARAERRRGKTGGGGNDYIGGEGGEAEDEELDAFLDDVLAKEMGTADEMMSESDDDGLELDEGDFSGSGGDAMDEEEEEEINADGAVSDDEGGASPEGEDIVSKEKRLRSTVRAAGRFMDADAFYAMQESKEARKKEPRVS